MEDFLILNNPLVSWFRSISTFVILFVFFHFIIRFTKSRMKLIQQKDGTITYTLFQLFTFKTNYFFLLVLSIYLGANWLTLDNKAILYLKTIFIITFWIQVGIWANYLLSWMINLHLTKLDESSDPTTLNLVKTVLRILLGSVIVILIIDNIPGVKITALLTSLGVGGIIIGLAVQSILGDLFASLSISIDKPFHVGDFIQVDDLKGVVQKIGLKSTRLKSISGEQIIFSNSDLVKSRILNFKHPRNRQVVIKFGVTYQTSPEKLKQIPEIIKQILAKEKAVTVEHIHLLEFGDFSINFELVYKVNSTDSESNLDIKQRILINMLENFINNGIEFSYPTQSIFIENQSKSEQIL